MSTPPLPHNCPRQKTPVPGQQRRTFKVPPPSHNYPRKCEPQYLDRWLVDTLTTYPIRSRKKISGMAVTILQRRLRGGGAGDGVARCGAASGARVIAAWSRVSGRGAGVRLCVSTAPGLRLPPRCPAPRVGGPAAPRFPVAPAALAPQPVGGRHPRLP